MVVVVSTISIIGTFLTMYMYVTVASKKGISFFQANCHCKLHLANKFTSLSNIRHMLEFSSVEQNTSSLYLKTCDKLQHGLLQNTPLKK